MKKSIRKVKSFKYELLVFAVFILSRMPDLGHDIFNTDVWRWKARIFDFGSGVFGLNFEQTVQRYHPGVTLMWIGSFAVKVFNFYYKIILGILPPDDDIATLFQLHFLQKFFIVVVIGITLASILYTLTRIINQRYALIFLILLIFEPFYVALTRVGKWY